MSEKHLIHSIVESFRRLPKADRVAQVRQFAQRSNDDADFIRRYFPELFEEAFPQRLRVADGCSKSDSPMPLVAKPHQF